MKNTQRGFALLIAIIFMAVVLSFGLALSSLGYKQEVLASTAIESQYAFYAADAALECALYYDQQQQNGSGQSFFAYPTSNPGSAPLIYCDGNPAINNVIVNYDNTASDPFWEIAERVSLDSGQHCADVTVYKYENPQPAGCGGTSGVACRTTYVFSQGYDVSCSTVENPNGARFTSRGLSYQY